MGRKHLLNAPDSRRPPGALVIALVAVCLAGSAAAAPAQDQPPHLLTLDEAMRLALERNPSINVAEAGAEGARASLRGQRARRLPTLDFGASGRISESLSRNVVVGGDTIRSGGGRSETSDVQLVLTHTFYQSGRDEAIDEARLRARAGDAGIEDARRRLLVDVAGTFYGVLARQELAEVAEDAVAAAQRHLDLVDARIEAGTVAPSDRLTVEAEMADARFEATRTINAVWTTLADLRALLALPTDELPLIRGDLDGAYPGGDLEDWIAEGLQARPDLEAQRLRVRASELALKQARIDAGLSLSVQGQADYGRHTGNTGDTWFIGGGLSYPLFDRQARASVDSAEAGLESARETLAEQELSVSRGISAAWYTLSDATARVAAAEASVAASAVSLEAARERYAEGIATIIEVTDAELSWRRARGNLVQARYDRNVAWYQLLAAAGRPLLDEAVAQAGAPDTTDEPNVETVGD